MAIVSGVGGRAFGIIASPRATFEAIARDPQWLGILVLTFLIAAGSAAIVLSTDVGQLALLDQWDSELNACYDVLRKYGNMSSPTILFVLKDLMEQIKEEKEATVFGAAFGPGLTMETFVASA